MRNLRRMLVVLAVAAAAVTALSSGHAWAIDCVPPQQPVNPAQAWTQGATITVVIDPAFTSDEQTQIKTAFEHWTLSSAGQASGVTFSFTTGSPGMPAANTYFVDRDTRVNLGGNPASTIPPGTGPANSAETSIADDVTNLAALEYVMAHEIGHTFGMADCSGCNPGQTVMASPVDTSNTFPGNIFPATSAVQGPTSCDSAAVITGDGYTTSPPGGGPCSTDPTAPCECPPTGCVSPITIDVDGSGYQLTDAARGVMFDFYGTRHPIRIAWTAPGSTNAFLTLPRNGTVTSGAELFGNLSPQPASAHPNGFAALAVYDRPGNGGNNDGIIDARDAIFTRLRLWQDPDHDGKVQPGELHTLPALGVTAISLNYHPVAGTDAHGNHYGYTATITTTHGATLAYDFFLTTTPAGGTSPAFPDPLIVLPLIAIALLGTALAARHKTLTRKRAAAPGTTADAGRSGQDTPTLSRIQR